MPRKGEYRRTERTVETLPSPTRIGLRRVEGFDSTGGPGASTLDPAGYGCVRLAGELADEWVELAATSQQGLGTARCYRRAIDVFCRFVDATLADAAAASLAHAAPDLLAVISEWIRLLPADYPPGSTSPAGLAWRLRTLILRRHQHPDRAVSGNLRGWLTGSVGLRRGTTKQVDEYSRADKQALVRAAWADVHVVEQRLRHGRELAETGVDPRVGGWTEPANLLWAITHAMPTSDIAAQLPSYATWPTRLRELDGVDAPNAIQPRTLLRVLVHMLHPHNLDLHPFRVLLMAATGHTSEEITGLAEDDVEFTPDGVLLSFTKNRAHAVRRRTFTGSAEPAALPHPSRPRLDAPAILRRLMAVTSGLRAASGLSPAPLFLRAGVHIHDMAIRPFVGGMHGAGFRDWLDHAGLALDGPADIRRLRKSGKVEKALAYRGRVSDIADDHSVEVFRGHYAHGTTLHVIAGQVITTAQQRWFTEAVTGPTVVSAEASLVSPAAPEALGLSPQQLDQLRSGALDMGVSGCRDPFDSPFGRSGDLCPVAPLRCLECRHAIVLPSNLPQLLLLADHLEQLRRRLTPQHFHALWGQSHANLSAVLADRTDTEIDLARKQIAAGEADLHLPLSAHVEFDR